MSEILAKDISVYFPLLDWSRRSVRGQLIRATTGGRIDVSPGGASSVLALDGLSFHIRHGDRVALIGPNGAGKSTLLRVLAAIYAPTMGKLYCNGRAVPLLDISFGMDGDLSGYDNIKIRGIFLGLTLKEINRLTSEIAEFSDLGSFLYMPVRTYSSGMQARLAFSISTAICPEILLMDEQISAGDAVFMEKAARRLRDLVARAGILVMASHATETLRKLCNLGMLLDRGRLVCFGPVNEVFATYDDLCRQQQGDDAA